MMSLAPPPPPPPAAPTPSFTSKSDSKDGRGLLLESIRKGTTLKKTVTVDKSAPLIGGSIGGKSSHTNNTNNPAQTVPNNKQTDSSPTHAGLGGLFVNGIPKLKATGLPIGQAYQQYRNENDVVKTNSLSANNNSGHNSTKTNNSNRTNFSKVRGPPPQPPGLPPKNNAPDSGTNDGLHPQNKSGSVNSLNDSYQNRASDVGQHIINHGKPTLAPKPHSIVNKSIGNKNTKNEVRSVVTRAQSMRVPRSSLSIAESDNGSQYPDYNRSELHRTNNKNNLPSFYQSQESLGGRNMPSLPQAPLNATSWSNLSNPNATLRRSHGSPLRPPLAKPPPPPRMMTGPPNCPPPPPPTHAPPPPPHRVNPAPPPPRLTINTMNSGVPPVPPVRNSSMRSSNSSNKMTPFESRFIFHNVEEFPFPQPYQNVIKIYNSRIQAKQQAPQPPLQLQQSVNRTWPCENASNC